MQLFFYERSHSGTDHPKLSSIAIRAAYLLADKSICTRLTDFRIHLPDGSNEKLATKERYVLDVPNDLGEALVADLREYRDMVRVFRKQKNKDRTILMLIKKYERFIDDSFRIRQQEEIAKWAKDGISQLRDLPMKDQLCYSISDEQPERQDDNFVPVSDLLLMLGDEEDRKSCHTDISFIVAPHIFQEPFFPFPMPLFDEWPLAGAEPHGADGQAWVAPLFRLPNINSLAAPELTAIRTQLSGAGAPFRQAFDAWIKGCVHEGWGAAQSATHFAQVVRPAAAPLQEALDANKVLAHRVASSRFHKMIEVLAACVPLRQLWAFWGNANAIADDTWEKLQAADADRGSILVPILIFAPEGARPGDAGGGDDNHDEAPLAPRRTLDLS